MSSTDNVGRRPAVPDGQTVTVYYEEHSEESIADIRRRVDRANGVLQVVTRDGSNPYPFDGEWPDGERVAWHPELASGVLGDSHA